MFSRFRELLQFCKRWRTYRVLIHCAPAERYYWGERLGRSDYAKSNLFFEFKYRHSPFMLEQCRNTWVVWGSSFYRCQNTIISAALTSTSKFLSIDVIWGFAIYFEMPIAKRILKPAVSEIYKKSKLKLAMLSRQRVNQYFLFKHIQKTEKKKLKCRVGQLLR